MRGLDGDISAETLPSSFERSRLSHARSSREGGGWLMPCFSQHESSWLIR